MISWLDTRFILETCSSFRNFKKKKDNLYIMACPVCGDSERKKTKARFYIYEKDGIAKVKCFNCEYSTNFQTFLRYIDPMKFREYSLEKFRNSNIIILPKPKIQPHHHDPVNFPASKIRINLLNITQLEENHYARKYIEYRKIPLQFHTSLYYAESFKHFIEELKPNHGMDLIENDPRIVIPFYNEEKKLICVQGRSLKNNKIRYITIKLDDESPKVFGLDRLDKSKDIRVLEGPIDATMVDNAIAVCDSGLSVASKYLSKEKLILIFDNQYTNKEVANQIEKSIEEGYRVCLFPKSIKEKDINDMVLSGLSLEQIEHLIEENTFVGMRAKFEFNCRRK